MARLIDADNLAEGLKYHYQPTDQECDFDRQWAVGYNAGLNRALYSIAYARTIEPKQEWISVKDRLPEQLKEVLICFDGYGRKSVSVATYRDYFYGKEWLSNMVSLSVDCVTHWMPLPEPPETE